MRAWFAGENCSPICDKRTITLPYAGCALAVAVTPGMPSSVLQCQGQDCSVTDRKSAPSAPTQAVEFSSFTRARHTVGCHPSQKWAQSTGQLLQLTLSLLSNRNIDRIRRFFCISSRIYDLIEHARGCSAGSCSGGDFWTPCSELKMNMAMRPWEGDSISTKANTTKHQQDTQIVALLLLNIRSALPLTSM